MGSELAGSDEGRGDGRGPNLGTLWSRGHTVPQLSPDVSQHIFNSGMLPRRLRPQRVTAQRIERVCTMANRGRRPSPSRDGAAVEQPTRLLLVSPSIDFSGGGGAIGFRDVVVALRQRRPDLELVAVYPQKGTVEAECARHGVRTEVARIGWWMYGEGWRGRLRVPFIESLVSVLLW